MKFVSARRIRCPSAHVVSLGLAALFALGAATPSSATSGRPIRHHHRREKSLPPAPSIDAVQLDIVAPPGNEATELQTYGDASYARARSQRRILEQQRADAALGPAARPVSDSCDPRIATSTGYRCDRDPRDRSYMQGYDFTPAFLSAPQHISVPTEEQSQILSPFTALSWAVDSLRADPHN